MPSLKPWYRVDGCQPREDLRHNRPLNEADFAVNLDHIRRGEGGGAHQDYVKPHLFFARTFMTKSLRELASGVVRRLSGNQSETAAVYNMATQFGGGKTHALATLYHLASNGDAARSWPGVDSIIVEAGVSTVPKASVAVIVGTEFDPIKGRQDGGTVRKTLWGEMAWQLGKERSFAAVAEHEAKAVAPAGDVIREMLPAGPCLILLDEVVNYVGRARKAGFRDQVFDFIQNLSETVRARDNVVLCASIPKSLTTEVAPEDEEDYSRLKHVLDRLGKAIMMSADLEMAEIIRRRLFEWKGMPPEGEHVAREYAAWVRDNAGAMTGIDPDRAYEQFKSAYPFHPAALSVFERKWQALPRFQRTRGVLRLLALWVARAFQEDHQKQFPDPVIGLGSAPIEDQRFRAALFEQLGSDGMEGPATTDIAGSANAHAVRMDKEANEAIRRGRLHQKAATVVFFESNGGQLKTEATLGEIKTAVGGPEVNLADIDHVLEGLIGACYFLTTERNRYRFSLTPNVNKILTDRRAAVQPKQIDDLLRREIESIFRAKPKDCDLDMRAFPERTNDVPDRPLITIVVLHPERPSETPATTAFMDKIIKECGNTPRSFKAALMFVAADAMAPMRDAARDVLAWREINEDNETKARLDDGQRKHLAVSVEGSKRALEDAIWRAYRHAYLLGTDGNLRLVDLGIVTRSAVGSPVENLINRLVGDDVVIPAPNARKLVQWWPPALTLWPTKAVRDAFFAMPKLGRLRQPDSIKRTIAEGVSRGDIGYARRKNGEKIEALVFRRPLVEAEVELSDDVVILRADDARKLQEPARMARLRLSPEAPEVAPGESVVFAAGGVSQYDEAIEAAPVKWQATGGTVDADGRFLAGQDAGLFTVTARCGSVEATANLRIRPRGAIPPPRPGVEGKQLLLWSGEVPPQKWMNFYTKVLSRFAGQPGLSLRVSVEASVDQATAKAKQDETRASLKELGLDDSVSCG